MLFLVLLLSLASSKTENNKDVTDRTLQSVQNNVCKMLSLDSCVSNKLCSWDCVDSGCLSADLARVECDKANQEIKLQQHGAAGHVGQQGYGQQGYGQQGMGQQGYNRYSSHGAHGRVGYNGYYWTTLPPLFERSTTWLYVLLFLTPILMVGCFCIGKNFGASSSRRSERSYSPDYYNSPRVNTQRSPNNARKGSYVDNGER